MVSGRSHDHAASDGRVCLYRLAATADAGGPARADRPRRRHGGSGLTPGAPCLVTTDMLLEGSCFRLAEAGPRRVGRKAMAVNLSDIAAMAGRPVAAVVSVGLPRRGGRDLAEELYRGLREVADAFDTAIVGGDTNSWDGPLVDLRHAARRGDAARPGAAKRRPAGDWLLVTGPLGGSILGKHLDFTPRVREALRPARRRRSARHDRRQRRPGRRRAPHLRRERLRSGAASRGHPDHGRGTLA